jgi:6,7-dimethyl-8-ribityllumazine synthase
VSVPEAGPGSDARGLRFCLVAARVNQAYVQRLAEAAREVLERAGAASGDVEVWWVPGSFELPLACRWAAESGRFDAVLAFGVLIRGETEHFRLIAEAVTSGLQRVSLDTGVPVLHGVLAVHETAAAEARAGGAVGNRGAEVALDAVQMAALRRAAGAR